MESIIVEIYIPATSTSFDFRLPSTGRVKDIIAEVIRILEATQQNLEFDRDQSVLCDRDRKIILEPEYTVTEAGLQDGCRLILV